ncbi:glycerophosphodiester phosphodiesterase [Sinimarinibacterium flocculans]|uniref:Glycerophosphoryl diester phosphodiesterase n=1 Tax=Sinimarinibacterium flocculans TaxID=985250 RepID=A0A318EAG2_9GAMM|nr:glycerophosphodiester phosphodiesterase family protein [Sinimarinibacterium flocculans]PXV66538.1 glycerophosphoryl diester phosphodiesterase [Sinimarinibacterium flocculans]
MTTEPLPRFTVIGHRGARGHAPENTLLSIDTAIRLGADWVEFDVQHHDGELWLMHDLTLDRTTNGRGPLHAHSADSLRRLDAGGGEIIPTLPEALDLIEQRVGVNVELKSWNGCAAAVAACLRDYIADGWPADRFLVSSFHLPELWEFKQLLPEVPLGALYCGVPLDWAGLAAELGAQTLNISGEFVDARLIADAHERGLRLYVYTVNDEAELWALRQMGVDGVFSDYPERALAVAGPAT